MQKIPVISQQNTINQATEGLQAQSLYGTTRPSARMRTNLTSVQINDTQKQSIDQAYRVFIEQAGDFTKGEFLEALCQQYLKKQGSLAPAPLQGGEASAPTAPELPPQVPTQL